MSSQWTVLQQRCSPRGVFALYAVSGNYEAWKHLVHTSALLLLKEGEQAGLGMRRDEPGREMG